MKDNFSTHSDQYALFRPKYPSELFEYINSLVHTKNNALDCGTGNGQVAIELSKTFDHVYATDISQAQINEAPTAQNIYYSIQAAEQTNFPSQLFDLIVVAQAVHWFDFDLFYSEVLRIGKPNALLCIIGYGRLKISNEIDPIISNFYFHTIGSYWDKERKYIDELYQTIPFPFEELAVPIFSMTVKWTLQQLIGYINTWSAVKHFMASNPDNPTDMLTLSLKSFWPKDEIKSIHFPLLIRIGKI